MSPIRRLILLGIVTLAASLSGRAGTYTLLHEIPLGGEGGWDYISVDPTDHRLYVSHATKVVVVDTQTDQVTGELAGTPGIHGTAVAAKAGRAYTSNGKENMAGIYDLKTFQPLGKVATGPNPDTIIFEPGRGEIYAFNGRGASVTIISAATGEVAATLPLGGKPEFAVADPTAGRVYVNIEDKNEIVAIDTKSHTAVAHWPITPGEEASGLDFDAVHHRLFAGCSNAKLIVLDSTDGHRVADIPAGQGIDAAAFDPGTQLAFVSNGRDGTVTVVHEDTPDKFTVVQTLITAPFARTMAVDPVSHKIYLPTAKITETPDPAGGRPHRQVTPGSFKVLVYGLKP